MKPTETTTDTAVGTIHGTERGSALEMGFFPLDLRVFVESVRVNGRSGAAISWLDKTTSESAPADKSFPTNTMFFHVLLKQDLL